MPCHGRVELSAGRKLRVEPSRDRKAGRYGKGTEKRPPEGAVPEAMPVRSVRLNTKDEPVVGRNIFHRE